MGLSIREIAESAPKDLFRTVQKVEQEWLDKIPDGLPDYLKEKIPELTILTNNAFAVLLILLDKRKLNETSIQQVLNKNKISTNSTIVNKVKTLFPALVREFKLQEAEKKEKEKIARIIKASAAIPKLDPVKTLQTMLDQIIEQYSRDEKEKDFNTVEQMKTLRESFQEALKIASISQHLVVPDVQYKDSIKPNLSSPAALVASTVADRDGNEETIFIPAFQLNFVMDHWQNFSNPLTRALFAATVIKEGTYFLELKKNPEFKTHISESINNLYKLICKKTDPEKLTPEDIVTYANDPVVIEGTKTYLQQWCHQEYIGFKNKYEFLHRQGFYHGMPLSTISSTKLPLSIALQISDSGKVIDSEFPKEKTVNEGSFKRFIIEEGSKLFPMGHPVGLATTFIRIHLHINNKKLDLADFVLDNNN